MQSQKFQTLHMKKKIFLSSLLLAMMCMMQSFAQNSQTSKIEPVKKGYAPVNGLQLYYEIYGQGQPTVLLHGGVGAIEMFASNLPSLAEKRQVIAVDLQAHGRTADINRPMSLEAMADDISGLLKYLSIEKADVVGYSLGGGVATQMAIRHAQQVRRLVVVSFPYKRSGWYPEIRAGMEQMGPQAAEPMKQTPLYSMYTSLAPKKEDWPVLLTKLGELLKKDYDYSKDVANIKNPVLIVSGDADAISPSESAEFFKLLGGGLHDAGWDGSGRPASSLAIIPGATHYNIFVSPQLMPTVITFLDAPGQQAK
jgi:pimeloyl-ACP methyl ester carboxylesterase